MDLSIFAIIFSIAMSVVTLVINSRSSSRGEGESTGSLKTNIEYIKESVDRIEKRLSDEVHHLGGRIDELSHQVIKVVGDSSKAIEVGKSLHKRVDALEGKRTRNILEDK